MKTQIAKFIGTVFLLFTTACIGRGLLAAEQAEPVLDQVPSGAQLAVLLAACQ